MRTFHVVIQRTSHVSTTEKLAASVHSRNQKNGKIIAAGCGVPLFRRGSSPRELPKEASLAWIDQGLETMYKSFFGLKESPFRVNPDPRYLYLTKEIEEALAGLMYGIKTRKGFVTLIGEGGTGKKTLGNHLLDWLKLQEIRTAFIFNSRVNTTPLFECILAEFHIPCESRSKNL